MSLESTGFVVLAATVAGGAVLLFIACIWADLRDGGAATPLRPLGRERRGPGWANLSSQPK